MFANEGLHFSARSGIKYFVLHNLYKDSCPLIGWITFIINYL